MTKAKDLLLGDFIILDRFNKDDIGGAFVVRQVTKTKVTLWRPYTHTESFAYTGGVLTFVGINEVTINRDDDPFQVVRASKVRGAKEHNRRADES